MATASGTSARSATASMARVSTCSSRYRPRAPSVRSATGCTPVATAGTACRRRACEAAGSHAELSTIRPRSEVGLARGARERDHVADVLHAGRVLDRALEAQAEAGVGHGAVAPEVAVPPVV